MFDRHLISAAALFLIAITSAAFGSLEKISSSSDFLKILKKPNGRFELQADIDFDSIKDNWKQIIFYGKIEGNNHIIRNVDIVAPANSNGGLFLAISGIDSCVNSVPPVHHSQKVIVKCNDTTFAEIRNIQISGKSTGKNRVGLFAGQINNAVIENIRAFGKVSGENSIGGIAGEVGPFVQARNIESSVEVNGKDYVGGFFGRSFWIDLRGGICHSTVHGQNGVGGTIGVLESSFTSSILFDGEIFGNDTVGGIVGLSVGSNRGKSILLTTQRLPGWFKSSFSIGMPMDYEGDYPPGGYSAFGNSECDCSGLIFSDTYQPYVPKRNENKKELIESSIGDWLVDAVFRGVVRCRNVCGGIRGSGKSHSLALHHALSTGEIYGNKKIGGISGNGKADLRFSDIVNGSVGYNGAVPMFGEAPTCITWGIQLLPSANSSRSDCESVYNNCKSPDTSIFSIGKMRWDGAYYPPGVLVPIAINDGITFKAIESQSGWDSISIGMPSLIDSIKNAEASGFQYWKHNSYSGSTNERFLMVDNFPPKLKKFKASFVSGCKPIDDFVETYNPNEFHASILPDSITWKISGNSICVNAESKIGSKAMLVIQRNNGGKSFLQLFKE